MRLGDLATPHHGKQMFLTRALFLLFSASFGSAVFSLEEQNPCDPVPECKCSPGITNGGSAQTPCVNNGTVLINAGFINKGCCPNEDNEDCPGKACVRKDALVNVTNGCTCNLVLESGGVGGAATVTIAPGAAANWGGGTYTTECGKTTFRYVYAYCDGPPFPQPLLSGSYGTATCVPVKPCLPQGE